MKLNYSFVCLLLAIIIKSALFFHFFTFSDDKLFQAVAAKNLTEGNGLTYHEVHAGSLDTPVKTPLNRWPPGYSLAIALFYNITGDLITATLIIDFIFIVAFFITLKKILGYLQTPSWVINLLILFNGFAIAPYLGMPTDLHAVVFILISIHLALKFYDSPANPVQTGFLIGFFSFLASFFRYMYIPSSVIVGGTILITGVFSKNKILVRGAVCSIATTVLCTILLIIFNIYYSGSAAYVMPMEKGFFPENLLNLYPFLISAFVNLNLVLTRLSIHTGHGYAFWYAVAAYINIATCLWLVYQAKRLSAFADLKQITRKRFFLFITAGIIAMCFLLTACLSLTNGPYRITLRPTNPWTFIADGRYFTFAIIILPVLLVPGLFATPAGRYAAPLRYLFIFLFVFQAFHTSAFLIRKLPFTGRISNATLPRPLKQYLCAHIEQLNRNNINVVITGDRETVANWGSLHGAKALLNSDELITHAPAAKKRSVLLLVTTKNNASLYKPFINNPRIQRDTAVGDFLVYSYITAKNEQ